MGYLRIPALVLTTVAVCAGQTQALLIDRSGSVQPYYESGLFERLSRAVVDILDPSLKSQLFVFSTDLEPVADLAAWKALPKKFGKDTLLDVAFDKAMAQGHSVVWMITDNVQDRPGDATAFNTDAFYKTLRGERVRRLVFFPVKQPPGLAGVAVYAAMLDESAAAAFEKEIEGFRRRASDFHIEALRMKPLDRGTVQTVVHQSSERPAVYVDGSTVHQQLGIGFHSSFDHLRIVDSVIKPVRLSADFGASSLLEAERREIDIRPDRIGTLNPREESGQEFKVDIDLGRVRLKRDLRTLFRVALGGKSGEDIKLEIPLRIEVPKSHFQLRESFLKTYHAGDPESAKATGRIYGMESLPVLMSNEMTPVSVDLSLSFRVLYPWWPSVVAIGLIVAALALLAALLFLVARIIGGKKRPWEVEAAADNGDPLDGEVLPDGSVIVEGVGVGRLEGKGFEPAPSATLIDGPADGLVSADEKWTLRNGRNTFTLQFHRAGRKPRGSGSEEPEPRRRQEF